MVLTGGASGASPPSPSHQVWSTLMATANLDPPVLYLGAPLRFNGQVVATLCCMYQTPLPGGAMEPSDALKARHKEAVTKVEGLIADHFGATQG